eukprot:6287307-Amphidinium_carterae.2
MEMWIRILNARRANPQLASYPPQPPAPQNEALVTLPARLQLLPHPLCCHPIHPRLPRLPPGPSGPAPRSSTVIGKHGSGCCTRIYG